MEIGLPKKVDFRAGASSNHDLGILCHIGKEGSIKILMGTNLKDTELGWRDPLSAKSGAIWALK